MKTVEELVALIERYRTAGGREEHHAYKEEIERVLEELAADADAYENEYKRAQFDAEMRADVYGERT